MPLNPENKDKKITPVGITSNNVLPPLPKDPKLENPFPQEPEKKALEETFGKNPIIDDKPKRNWGKYGCVALFIFFIPIFFISLFLILSALGVANNNEFSHLSTLMHPENIPLVNMLVKNPKLMVFDSFISKPNVNAKSFNQKVVIKLNLSQPTNNYPTVIDYSVKYDISKNTDNNSFKQSFVLGGKMVNGVDTIDFGENGISIDYIAPNNKDWYIKFDLSNEFKRLLQIDTTKKDIYNSTINKLLNNYIKYSCEPKKLTPDDPDFFKPVKPNNCANNSISIDSANFSGEITPRFQQLFKRFALNVEKSINVTNLGRVSVNNVDSFKLKVDTEKTSFDASFDSLLDDISLFIFDNNPSFSKLMCSYVLNSASTATAAELTNCTNLSARSMTQEEIKKITDSLKGIEISNIYIYVNTKTNELTKITLDLDFNTAKLDKEYCNNVDGCKETDIKLSIDYENTPSENEVNITAPEKYKELYDLQKDIQKVFNMIK